MTVKIVMFGPETGLTLQKETVSGNEERLTMDSQIVDQEIRTVRVRASPVAVILWDQ